MVNNFIFWESYIKKICAVILISLLYKNSFSKYKGCGCAPACSLSAHQPTLINQSIKLLALWKENIVFFCCLFISTSLWSNVWTVSSLKSNSLRPNYKVAVSQFTMGLTQCKMGNRYLPTLHLIFRENVTFTF